MPGSTEFTSVLAAALGPIALISGVGLILLSLVNRLARVIDRARSLVNEILAAADPAVRKIKERELRVIHQRAKLLRLAMICIVTSILSTSAMIIVMIVANLAGVNLNWLADALLLICAAGIFFSSLFFLLEVIHALQALEIDLRMVDGSGGVGAGVDDKS